MTLAIEHHDDAQSLRYAADAASLIERFMLTRPSEYHDIYSMRYFYSNVAESYYEARHFSDAIRYGQRGLDIPLPSTQGTGATLSVMAAARWQLGDLNGALQVLDQAIALEQGEAADGHASLRINLATGYDLQGMILGRADAEPSLGRSQEALAVLRKAADIAEDLAQKDASDYLGRHNVATADLEIGNILRHRDPRAALAVYDHALARIRELPRNVTTQRDEVELLAASSYAERWTTRGAEPNPRVAKALDMLHQAGWSTNKVEPMSAAYDVLRARADDYAERGRADAAIDAYRGLLDALLGWRANIENDLRDATCISRTWTALAQLLNRAGHAEEAAALEARRTELFNRWNGKLADAEFLLHQSLTQIAPP
jgi:hypothetical protein